MTYFAYKAFLGKRDNTVVPSSWDDAAKEFSASLLLKQLLKHNSISKELDGKVYGDIEGRPTQLEVIKSYLSRDGATLEQLPQFYIKIISSETNHKDTIYKFLSEKKPELLCSELGYEIYGHYQKQLASQIQQTQPQEDTTTMATNHEEAMIQEDISAILRGMDTWIDTRGHIPINLREAFLKLGFKNLERFVKDSFQHGHNPYHTQEFIKYSFDDVTNHTLRESYLDDALCGEYTSLEEYMSRSVFSQLGISHAAQEEAIVQPTFEEDDDVYMMVGYNDLPPDYNEFPQ